VYQHIRLQTLHHKSRSLWHLALVCIFVLAGCLLSSEELEAQPFATWSEQNVERIIAVDDRTPVRLTLTVTESIPETTLEVTPGLRSWVTHASPEELPALSPGDEVTVDLVLTAPWIGTEDGTLKLRERGRSRGKGRVYSRPLALSVEGVRTIEESLPPEPDPTVNASTLLGVDSNSNGVRDDLERMMALDFPNDPGKREAAYSLFRVMSLVYDPSTYDAHTDRINYARACLRYTDYPEGGFTTLEQIEELEALHAYGRELHKRYYDTFDRARAYLTYNNSLAATIIDVPHATPETCDFDLEALEQ